MITVMREMCLYAESVALQVIFVVWYIFEAFRKQFLRLGPRKAFSVKTRQERPGVLDDKELGDHRFTRFKTVTLHYVSKGPEDGRLMLLLHGFPESWYSWRHQLREFGGKFRVVAVDMRGYGESGKPTEVGSYVMTNLVEDMKQLIFHLGYKHCVVVGHDWGGLVAWTLASIHPQMVTRLILVNIPHPRAFTDYIWSSATQIIKSSYIFVFQWPILAEILLRMDDLSLLTEGMTEEEYGGKPGTFTMEDLEAYKHYFNNYYDLVGPVNYYRAMMRYPEDFHLADTTTKTPTLVIWGDSDAFLNKELAELSAQYAVDYTVKYIKGGSHWIHMEEPETVNKHINEFLSSKKLN